jgi:hypothetical protein
MSAEPEYANHHRSMAGIRLSVVTGENAAPPGIIHIQDAAQVYEIMGVLVDAVSTEVPYKPQWLEISLYRCHDNSGRYVLHFVGRSVLYHAPGSQCNTGVPTAVSDTTFPPDAEPCRRCKPPKISQLSSGELQNAIFELEMDRHKVEVADGRTGEPAANTSLTEDQLWDASAKIVLQLLHDSWQQRPSSTATLSAPAQRLVDIAANHDPHVAAAIKRVIKL